MASLIRLVVRASHLEIRVPTSIFGWSFHNHQEATGSISTDCMAKGAKNTFAQMTIYACHLQCCPYETI